MQQELRFATFNAFNLAPPGVKLYDNLLPSTPEQYEAKLDWTARQIDLIDADVIGFQEIFSQAALRAALARTTKYCHAAHIGFDPDPDAPRLTPSVALVTRLPQAQAAAQLVDFPVGIDMPPGSRDAERFTRAPLHVALQVTPDLVIDVVVVHLKSRRPDYRNGDSGDDPQLYALACLRSLVRRGTEAAALRVLLADMARRQKRPRIVMGDFNDVSDAVTTGIVMGVGAPLGERLFDACQLQRRFDCQRDVAFSCVHDGRYSTIDHVLVSEDFHRDLPNAIGEVVDVISLNDHLLMGLPGASDHGQVIARLRLFDESHGFMEAGL
jgi:endonuclease/exonuclease/phosphatase family metal-dependent hydrolase